MSTPLIEAAAEARLLAFNLLIESIRGQDATADARERAIDVTQLADAVIQGQATPGHIRRRIDALLEREMEPG